MTNGQLFNDQARKQFTEITGQRYDAMRARLKKKNLAIPFTKDQFRFFVLKEWMGNAYDGAIQCRYCFALITLAEAAIDHAVPLSRNGSPGLSNLELPCAACNDRKGEMLPAQYSALLSFLEREIPSARVAILKRLQEHSKLLANQRRNQAVITELKKTGKWPAKKPKAALPPPMQKVIDDAF